MTHSRITAAGRPRGVRRSGGPPMHCHAARRHELPSPPPLQLTCDGRKATRLIRGRFWAGLFAMLCAAAAQANPLAVTGIAQQTCYMTSEQLIVSLTSQSAQLHGTFRFKSILPADGFGHPVYLDVPVWLPEAKLADKAVAEILKLFKEDGSVVYKTNLTAKIRKVLGMRAVLGKKPLLLAKVFKNVSREETQLRWLHAEHFECLILRFYIKNHTSLLNEQLLLSYRQPLLRRKGLGHFYYVPMFYNQPKGESTTDPERYAITLVAKPEVSLAFSNGTKRVSIKAGEKMTINPQHLEELKVEVKDNPVDPSRPIPVSEGPQATKR